MKIAFEALDPALLEKTGVRTANTIKKCVLRNFQIFENPKNLNKKLQSHNNMFPVLPL